MKCFVLRVFVASAVSTSIGIIGGTGDQGRGLAYRFATAGLEVLIGSRSAERASEVAREFALPNLRGSDNVSVAKECAIAIIAVPWAGHEATLKGLEPFLRGKIVIDCVNPLGFDEKGAYPLKVAEGSACEQAQALLPESTVVGAFHNVSSVVLLNPEVAEIAIDVLVLGDERTATDQVQTLAELLPGVRGIYGGRLRNAGQIEAFTANLISINRRYKAHSSLRITL
jgi:NADPH-dependent F420 reductase